MSKPQRRVVVHIGLPKTGSTFLQASLEKHKPQLRDAGVRYPSGEGRMFLAALDVRGTHEGWGRKRGETEGAWKALCAKAREHRGTTLLSHELLAAAPRDRIADALRRLDGLDVHVVVTVRDLARQAVAEWQEGIKHGRRLSFATFTETVLADGSDSDHARRFRASQDLPQVLDRWSAAAGPDRVHVVTCPPPGAAPDLLWRRFGDAAGFDARRLEPAGREAGNESLGRVEVALLRQVNKALDRRLEQPAYGRTVKEVYAQQVLARRTSPRPTLPADLYDGARTTGERWVKQVLSNGHPVHGDLADLLPHPPGVPDVHPDRAGRAELLASSVASTADLLVRLAANQAELADALADNERLRRKRRVLRRRLKKAQK